MATGALATIGLATIGLEMGAFAIVDFAAVDFSIVLPEAIFEVAPFVPVAGTAGVLAFVLFGTTLLTGLTIGFALFEGAVSTFFEAAGAFTGVTTALTGVFGALLDFDSAFVVPFFGELATVLLGVGFGKAFPLGLGFVDAVTGWEATLSTFFWAKVLEGTDERATFGTLSDPFLAFGELSPFFFAALLITVRLPKSKAGKMQTHEDSTQKRRIAAAPSARGQLRKFAVFTAKTPRIRPT